MKLITIVMVMATVLSLQAQAKNLDYRIECTGITSAGTKVGFSIEEIGKKDSWGSVTAGVYAHHNGQKNLLCDEAWMTGLSEDRIDDELGINKDLYVECGGERSNEVYYQLRLNKKGESLYTGSFQVGEGLSPFGLTRFGGSQEIICAKVQR